MCTWPRCVPKARSLSVAKINASAETNTEHVRRRPVDQIQIEIVLEVRRIEYFVGNFRNASNALLRRVEQMHRGVGNRRASEMFFVDQRRFRSEIDALRIAKHRTGRDSRGSVLFVRIRLLRSRILLLINEIDQRIDMGVQQGVLQQLSIDGQIRVVRRHSGAQADLILFVFAFFIRRSGRGGRDVRRRDVDRMEEIRAGNRRAKRNVAIARLHWRLKWTGER